MEFKAKLKNVYANYVDDCTDVVFEIAEPINAENLSLLTSKEQFCKVKVTNWSEKRSLDANKYCWVLCTKLAEVMKSSKDEIYEGMIQQYGYLDDDPIVITVAAKVDMSHIDGHWKFYKESADGKFKSYMRIRGSSEYTKKEMAHFLDMVVTDCKEAGVEILTPEEINQLKETWRQIEK